MNVATLIVGIVVIAVIAAAVFVLYRDSRNGNHCASCRGCSMGACKGDNGHCHCNPKDEDEEE